MVYYQTLYAIASIIFLLLYYSVIGFLLYPVFSNNKTHHQLITNESLFIGLIANILFLYFWNLFFPISDKGFLIFISICVLIGIKSKSINELKINIERIKFRFILFILFISIWLGFLSNNNIGPYDFGLYHLQVIKWAESFHIVKGIGNLHSRLGFSCSSWLLSSQFNVVFNTKLFFWTHGAIFLIIGFVNFAYIPIFSKIKIKKLEFFFRILYLPVLVNFCFKSFPGTSSDLPVFLFTSIISLYYLNFIIYRENISLNMIVIIAVLGISSKLSFVTTLIGLSFPILLLIIREFSVVKYVSKTILLLSLTTFLLWTLRNIIMTGYPFYPYSKVSLPVEWKMDELTVENTKNQIVTYSRGYIELKSFTFKERLKWYLKKISPQHKKIEIFYPMVIGIFGMFYSMLFLRAKLYKILILALPSIIPILFWLEIPGSRFFSTSFWWFGTAFIVFP